MGGSCSTSSQLMSIFIKFLHLFVFAEVMKTLIDQCIDGANTRELCKIGDDLIEKECGTTYKKLKKGV